MSVNATNALLVAIDNILLFLQVPLGIIMKNENKVGHNFGQATAICGFTTKNRGG